MLLFRELRVYIRVDSVCVAPDYRPGGGGTDAGKQSGGIEKWDLSMDLIHCTGC